MNSKGPADTFVSSYLLYLLAASSEVVSAQFHNHVRSHGIRVPEWRVLACLSDRDGLMITELARYSLVEQSRMTRIIGQMSDKGLVVRENDSSDKRLVRVCLTGKGRDMAEGLVRDAREHERQLLRSLNGVDGEALKNALQVLLRQFEDG